MKKTTTQYYVEIVDKESGDYILQSRWFDNQEDAEQWAFDSFDYIRHSAVDLDLMKAEWDDEEGIYEDIHFVKALNNTSRPKEKVLYELLVSYNNGKDFELIAEYETIEQATEKQTIEANYWLSNQSFKKNEKIIYEINKIEYDANDEQTDNIDFISELEIFGNY